MLSYQHGFHAGNLADLHKHLVLSLVLDYLAQKPSPMTVLDVYAGRGRYDLGSREAKKTGEAAQGIQRLWGDSWPDVCQPYRRALLALNPGKVLKTYPGSPVLARHFLRPGDVHHLCELHPQEFDSLRSDRALKAAHCHRRDALEALVALTPPPQRRGLCLVDPSYEVKQEYHAVAKAVATAFKRWPQGCFLVWYPILASQAHRPMVDTLSNLDASRGSLRSEVRRVGESDRMLGSGMLVLNPPWQLAAQLAEAEPWLAQLDPETCAVLCRVSASD